MPVNRIIFPSVLLFALALYSCQTTEVKPQGENASPAERIEAPSDLSQQEQDRKAFELFQTALTAARGTDRKIVVSKLETIYNEIIYKYPKAALSQESCSRLFVIYLRDYQPPPYEKINALFDRFMSLYPGSPFRTEIEKSVTETYYRNERWQDLISIYAPRAKQYIQDGKLASPADMFYYAEAKMNLGDLVEAAKGYKIVISKFPDSKEGSISRERLDKIRNMQEKK